MINIIDPRVLPEDQMPFIVLSDQANLIAHLIDWRTNIAGLHAYCHAMVAIDPGKFCSQGVTFLEQDMANWMRPDGVLTFVQLVNNSPAFTNAFKTSVQRRLSASWWTKMYDFLGIFGQAIGQDWIHTPGLEYCSVDVIRHLVNACPYLPKADQLVINAIPRESSPEYLWYTILQHPEVFSVYGTWDPTQGGVIV
jgi:hypothetical protein